MKHTSSGRVDRVIDAGTLLLSDGKIVRLTGFDYPFIHGKQDGGAVVAAKLFLEDLLPKGTELQLYQTRDQKIPRIDRMGHSIAHIVRKKDGTWINGMLVRKGMAWAAPDAAAPDMAPALYTQEILARKEESGLWGKDSAFPLLTPDNAGEGEGAFRVVEGVVNRAATSRNNLYLNFGEDWKKDFTVMITPAQRRQMARSGIDPMALGGQRVRVRGWIRAWNGPFMELETPVWLEIEQPPALPLAASP